MDEIKKYVKKIPEVKNMIQEAIDEVSGTNMATKEIILKRNIMENLVHQNMLLLAGEEMLAYEDELEAKDNIIEEQENIIGEYRSIVGNDEVHEEILKKSKGRNLDLNRKFTDAQKKNKIVDRLIRRSEKTVKQLK